MNALTSPTSGEEGASPAALLKVGGLILVLPQDEICAMEAVAAINTQAAGPHSVGWANYGLQRLPVFCLSDALLLLSDIPPERRTCVILAAEDEHLAILCDDIRTMPQVAHSRHEVPRPMKLPQSPIAGLLAINDGIGCLSSARLLASHVRHLRAEMMAE